MKNLRCKLIMLVVATTCLIGSGYAQTCPDGMVSFWKFDDLSTDLFIDSYGNHDAESETAIATEVVGKVGSAKYLSGTNFMSVADHADFDFPANSSFSVECWVKYADANLGRNQVIIGKRDTQTSGAHWFLGIQDVTGKVIFEVQSSAGVYQVTLSPNALLVNVWHHIVGIRDEATNTDKLYIDGTLVASTIYDYTGDYNSDRAIMIGAYPNTSGIPAYFYEGNIDETAIYNRALTQAEITDHILKNNSAIGYCDGLSPVIKSTPVTTAIVGQQYLYTVVASGMPTMVYSLLTGPAGMTIDGGTGTLSWTPASIDINAWVEVRASNNVAPADTQRFRIFLAEAPECPDGIAVLLKLDETSGPTYIDYYNDHHSTATVSPSPTAGIVNGGQAFNATTGIDIPDNASEFDWTFNSDFSFEFWMKTSTTSTMVIMGRHRKSDDFPASARWWVGTNSSGLATFSLQDNHDIPKLFEISGGTPLSNNAWHHVIAVRDGSAQQNRLYVDGVRVVDVTTNYANSFMADDPTQITVGYWDRDNPSSNYYHYTGALDEVAIFNKAITDAEALAFFNVGAPVGHCAIENFAPIITSTPVTDATEGVLYTYAFTVEDVDATDIITLSAPTKPDWLNFNFTVGQKTATLTGTPTSENVGDHDVMLQVSDGTVTRDQSFTITVENVNDAPVITSTPILDGFVDELYAYVFTATDVDGEVILSSVQIPDWLAFDAETGILSGTPEQADTGEHQVILRASDGTIDVDQEFTINVDGPSGLDDLETAGISLYPVPARTDLTVRFGSQYGETMLDVINVTGNIVKRALVPANQEQYTLDLQGIEPGAYYLHIHNNSINNIGRFVVVK